MAVEDAMLVRSLMRDLAKHPVDISELQLYVSHGVVYLKGKLKTIRGFHEDADLDEELVSICKVLRQRPGVRDVIVEVQTGSYSRLSDVTKKRRKVEV